MPPEFGDVGVVGVLFEAPTLTLCADRRRLVLLAVRALMLDLVLDSASEKTNVGLTVYRFSSSFANERLSSLGVFDFSDCRLL